ncbi:hypothetical protein HLA87_02440 [Mycoplasma miroungigenitalium]|uniref:Uncharacterized protein n=1 Tax=Mycoplasma miroungigenitalium TaxID=754515 RepID=A0A6M4J9K9_9MOLU|nr:hypothetical protein [Mycoplasma miroungigenitalium]QJR43633.1 hypothetical protein HLA87_02440 [Mycoplasma miroungigenitalium]
MNKDFDTLINIENDKELAKEFKTLLEQNINRKLFLKIIRADKSQHFIKDKQAKIYDRTLKLIPDSSYAKRRSKVSTSLHARQFGKLKDLIVKQYKDIPDGVNASVSLDKNVKGYQRGIYFSIIRGYRKASDGHKLRYRYSKKGAKTEALNKARNKVIKNDNAYVANYVREVFVPEYHKLIKEDNEIN